MHIALEVSEDYWGCVNQAFYISRWFCWRSSAMAQSDEEYVILQARKYKNTDFYAWKSMLKTAVLLYPESFNVQVRIPVGYITVVTYRLSLLLGFLSLLFVPLTCYCIHTFMWTYFLVMAIFSSDPVIMRVVELLFFISLFLPPQEQRQTVHRVT